ncbi:hypothetical protein ASAP_2795 [Asaia bogorensis]|uniref:Uncharacterized protein n=1 Tax=Asaia bogorensis TaxID=91915 RepID=A0A060QIS1_9PROT|nr:hypothetical protein ASAP_2795 [Asaia bogorensis]
MIFPQRHQARSCRYEHASQSNWNPSISAMTMQAATRLARVHPMTTDHGTPFFTR